MVTPVKVHAGLKILGSLNLGLNSTEFPENPELGTIHLKDFDLYAYVTVGGLNTWYPLIRGIKDTYLHNQGGENSVWTVNHNLGTTDIWYQIQDADGNLITPMSYEKVDGNTFKLHFAEPTVGIVLVIGSAPVNVPTILAELIKVGAGVEIGTNSISLNGSQVLTVAQMTPAVEAALAELGVVSTAELAAGVNEAKAYADTLVVGLWDDRGNYDPTVTALYPASGGSGIGGVVVKGDIWTISVNGTIKGKNVVAQQTVRALVDNPGQVAANWAISSAFDLATYLANWAPYDLAGGCGGTEVVTAGMVMLDSPIVRKTRIPANFAGSFARSRVAATAQTILNVKANNVQIGTITFAAGSTSGVFSAMASAVDLLAGQWVEVIASAADTTLAGVSFTIKADLVQ